MNTLKARVVNGRLVLDEPIDLPEGTELELVIADAQDDLDDDERQALDKALTESWNSARKGDLLDHADVMKIFDKP